MYCHVVLQLFITLRYLATGTFQSTVGELIGVSQATASRTITRVTNALVSEMPTWVKLPNQSEANTQKYKFFQMASFPNVFGCVDGTHVRIQAPRENEHEYVNRKNFHSINVQAFIRIACRLLQCAWVVLWGGGRWIRTL